MRKKPPVIDVQLKYLVQGENARWRRLELTEERYFDPKYRLAGKDAISSVPLHQDSRRYLDAGVIVSAVKVMLTNRLLKQRRVINTSYWNNSELAEVQEYGIDGASRYKEMILSQKIAIAGKSGWLVERWTWENQRWRPTSCSFVEELEDGSQRDHPIEVNGESSVPAELTRILQTPR